MAFWGTDTIRIRQVSDYLVLPFDNTRISNGQYLLSVGPESFITVNEVKTVMNSNYGQISIEPGQFAIILTEETVTIPKNSIGFISIRAAIKFRGLVNVSGFHVDPGFTGRLKFAVYNAGPKPIVLERGQAAFPIWFADMDNGNSDEYNGVHKDQRHITADDVNMLRGQIASPNALKKEIDDLRHEYEKKYIKLEHYITIIYSVGGSLLAILSAIILKFLFAKIK
ncbi:hypothetical protein [Geobacter sp. AOG2]|uniref:dCTP deaminase domain-containing protein n=1 Tax=Geobacter sp. AOG2 TaxID=1566347 RepID=UPI001CC40C14|nr:hypothetical protein [Geobacter sp. AOG2]GFE59579.1 hypothetical protein AOG2_01670 [Geobacter sp. AOG2]